MPHCIDEGTIQNLIIQQFDGNNWEETITTSDIKKFSKNWFKNYDVPILHILKCYEQYKALLTLPNGIHLPIFWTFFKGIVVDTTHNSC